MSEFIERSGSDIEADRAVRRRKELSFELFESAERFHFPGLRAGAYEQLKADEEYVDADFVTPIDRLLELFKEQGMVVDGGQQLIKTEKSPSIVTVRPAQTDGGLYGENLLHLKNLEITADMEQRLSELILLARM